MPKCRRPSPPPLCARSPRAGLRFQTALNSEPRCETSAKPLPTGRSQCHRRFWRDRRDDNGVGRTGSRLSAPSVHRGGWLPRPAPVTTIPKSGSTRREIDDPKDGQPSSKRPACRPIQRHATMCAHPHRGPASILNKLDRLVSLAPYSARLQSMSLARPDRLERRELSTRWHRGLSEGDRQFLAPCVSVLDQGSSRKPWHSDVAPLWCRVGNRPTRFRAQQFEKSLDTARMSACATSST